MARKWWRTLLLVLVVAPLLPAITIAISVAVAFAAACTRDQHTPCLIASIPVGDVISVALQVSATGILKFRAQYSETYLLLAFGAYLGMCYLSILSGWHRLRTRLALGAVTSVLFAFVPFMLPTIVVNVLAYNGCMPSAGGGKPCAIFGEDVGNPADDAIVLGAKLASASTGLVLCMLALYTVITVLIALGKRGFRTQRGV
jgi:hypothetical protein